MSISSNCIYLIIVLGISSDKLTTDVRGMRAYVRTHGGLVFPVDLFVSQQPGRGDLSKAIGKGAGRRKRQDEPDQQNHATKVLLTAA
jgi:hypothetical protein